jgi:hypothetical protein
MRSDGYDRSMSGRWSVAVGLVGAGVGVVVWASNLTLVQGSTEPVKLWHDTWASNNSYWARDLRWMALVTVFAGLVLALRGDRRRSAGAGLAILSLIGVDLVLDRLDLAGGPAAGWLSVAACALILTAWLFARRGAAPDRVPLVVAASVAAATAPLAAGIESPTNIEPALAPLALLTGCLLLTVAVACAVAAAPDRSRTRLAAAGALAVVGGAAVALLRVVEPGLRALPFMLLGGLLLAGVAAVVCPWRRGTTTTMVVLIAGYPVLLLTAIMAGYMMPVASVLTAAAGNPPVDASDADLLVTSLGVWPGLVLGGLLAVVSRTRRRWIPFTSDRLPA